MKQVSANRQGSCLHDLTINSFSATLDRQGKITETVVHCGN